MKTGIFVTGTDTGVGKTVVCAALLARLRADGIDAVPMKPVQTGCEMRNGALAPTDLEFALAAAGLHPSPRELELMAPYRFEMACSPHLAAASVSQAISANRILSCFHELAACHEVIILEGAGGILVPLGEGLLMLDLMVMLNLPVILVSRPGLGTINHTLLSLRELQRAGLQPLGVVFNEAKPSPRGAIEADNRRTIERLAGPIGIWRLPFSGDLTEDSFRDSPRGADWMREMPAAGDILRRV